MAEAVAYHLGMLTLGDQESSVAMPQLVVGQWSEIRFLHRREPDSASEVRATERRTVWCRRKQVPLSRWEAVQVSFNLASHESGQTWRTEDRVLGDEIDSFPDTSVRSTGQTAGARDADPSRRTHRTHTGGQCSRLFLDVLRWGGRKQRSGAVSRVVDRSSACSYRGSCHSGDRGHQVSLRVDRRG